MAGDPAQNGNLLKRPKSVGIFYNLESGVLALSMFINELSKILTLARFLLSNLRRLRANRSGANRKAHSEDILGEAI